MLRIYNVVLEMVAEAAGIAKEIEKCDKDLASQMRRAAASVALNTAEGMGNTGVTSGSAIRPRWAQPEK
jgi:four helix bundle protein